MRSQGVTLLNEGINEANNADEISKWWQLVKDWAIKVKNKMSPIEGNTWVLIGVLLLLVLMMQIEIRNLTTYRYG